ncbi:1549_t:CDS:2 [Cetraspora pellucida]|uniref:1549_t:CDS:1 n=1 Tax=Cetraspora pellucida TaxID=1433469 RepID=A0ACA9K4B6_9GLOM|nr:1549_t:CDS:2 [Cetraspora pellucida]
MSISLKKCTSQKISKKKQKASIKLASTEAASIEESIESAFIKASIESASIEASEESIEASIEAAFTEAASVIKISNENSSRTKLISTIQQLPDKELSSVNNLISIMWYPRGSNKDYESLQDSNLQLEKQNKKLNRKNQMLIRQTQSLGIKT